MMSHSLQNLPFSRDEFLKNAVSNPATHTLMIQLRQWEEEVWKTIKNRSILGFFDNSTDETVDFLLHKNCGHIDPINLFDGEDFLFSRKTLTNSSIFRIGELVIEGQLKRYPLGMLSVGALSSWGEPLVIITRPLVGEKTPFPTTFYLTHPSLVKAVSRIEATGVMTKLSVIVEKNAYIRERYYLAHHLYLDFRKKLGNLLGDNQQYLGDRTAGGLPTRVKCLHALTAQSLVMGPGVNPIGDWVLYTIGFEALCQEEINSLQNDSFNGFSYDAIAKIFSYELIRSKDSKNNKSDNDSSEENKKIYYYRLLLGKIFLKYAPSWVRRISCNFDITKEYDQEKMVKCINEDLKSF